jgi:uncharacterized integral membrane protein
MSEHDGASSPRRFDGRLVATVIATILLAWFAIANWQHVEIRFWVLTVHAPLTLVIAVAAALGGFVAWVARRRRTGGHD